MISTCLFDLGWRYANGDRVKRDDAKAVYWYRKSAEQGNASAQNNLGVMYYYGKRVIKNLTTAKKYFKQACNNGNKKGCENQ